MTVPLRIGLDLVALIHKRRFGLSSLVARRATRGARACQPACRRVAIAAGLLIAASTLVSPAVRRARQHRRHDRVPRPRPQRRQRRLDQQAGAHRPRRHQGLPGQRHLDRRRLSRAHLHLGHHAAHPPGADRARVCGPRCPAATTPALAPASTSARAMANALRPNAIVSIHGDGGPPTGRGFHVLYSSPPLNQAQAGPVRPVRAGHARSARRRRVSCRPPTPARTASTRAPTSPG